MKIMYDYQILWMQEYGGISRYFYELVNQLTKGKRGIQIDIPVISAQNEYFRKILKYKRAKNKLLERVINEAWTIIKLIMASMKHEPYQIVHLTYYLPLFFHWFIHKKDTKIVITVYDMIHEKFMNHEKRVIRRKKEWIVKSDGIIAISESTKKDLLEIYPDIPHDKVRVIYLGGPEEVLPEEVFLPEKYIMFIGNRNDYKNFSILLEKVVVGFLKRKNIKILCVGGGEWTDQERKLIKLRKMEAFIWQKSLTDGQIAFAYKKAICLVYPSLCEGFGIPILEAFRCDCPVVLSDILCFREIAGDAAKYFDGNSPESLLKVLSVIVSNEEEKQKQIVLGRSKLCQYAWKFTAQQTYEYYQSLIEN